MHTGLQAVLKRMDGRAVLACTNRQQHAAGRICEELADSIGHLLLPLWGKEVQDDIHHFFILFLYQQYLKFHTTEELRFLDRISCEDIQIRVRWVHARLLRVQPDLVTPFQAKEIFDFCNRTHISCDMYLYPEKFDRSVSPAPKLLAHRR